MLVTDVAKHVMPRPSHNIDKRMLEAAKKIVCEHGCSGIRIRDIAAKAHANLGMFHYYFKSKRRFTKVLLQDCYDDFFSRLSILLYACIIIDNKKTSLWGESEVSGDGGVSDCYRGGQRRNHLHISNASHASSNSKLSGNHVTELPLANRPAPLLV